MLDTAIASFLVPGALGSLKQFVSDQKLHPILVNFTAALIPVSIFSDIAARLLRRESLRTTAWWTLCFAACLTPLTAAAGWLFWMTDDNGVKAMTLHKWLGTSLAALFVALAVWRGFIYRRGQWPGAIYLLLGLILVAATAYQGHLGGDQSFGSMSDTQPQADMPAPHDHSKMRGGDTMGDSDSHKDQRMHDSSTTAPASDTIHWHDHIDLK